jgi:uncharacterized protein (DUF885 family)
MIEQSATDGDAMRHELDRFLPEYLCDDPEMLTALGLAAASACSGELTIGSDSWVRERIARARQLRASLRRSPAELGQSAQILDWYLTSTIAAEDFVLLSYPVHDRGELSDLFLTGVPLQALLFLLRGHQLFSRQDVFDFVSRLFQVPAKLQAAEAALELRWREGLPTPAPILRAAIAGLRDFLAPAPRDSILLRHFAQGIRLNQEVTEQERRQLVATVAQAVETEIYPAYWHLLNVCDERLPSAPETCSLARRPRGEACYRYLLHRHLGFAVSEPALLQLGWHEIERVREEILIRLSDLGAPAQPGQPVWEAWQAALQRQPDLLEDADSQASLVALWIDQARERVAQQLGWDSPQVKLAYLPEQFATLEPEGYYEAPSCLNRGAAVFHLNRQRAPRRAGALKTLVLHETVPGHHSQIMAALHRAPALPAFLSVLPFPGWSEGWATYAEGLAAGLGLYADDLIGDVGRLAAELQRAVRLVLDVGMHAEGWGAAEARQRIGGLIGWPDWLDAELSRAAIQPARGCAYTFGMHHIRRLRQTIGRQLDNRTFATALLRSGPCPLELLNDCFAANLPAASVSYAAE